MSPASVNHYNDVPRHVMLVILGRADCWKPRLVSCTSWIIVTDANQRVTFAINLTIVIPWELITIDRALISTIDPILCCGLYEWQSRCRSFTNQCALVPDKHQALAHRYRKNPRVWIACLRFKTKRHVVFVFYKLNLTLYPSELLMTLLSPCFQLSIRYQDGFQQSSQDGSKVASGAPATRA